MIKFSDIIEGVYGRKDDDYGFKDSSFDDIKIYMDLLISFDDFALLKNPKDNSLYITYTADIDSDYYQAWYSYEVDQDEDGRYEYKEYSDDIELTDESIELFTQLEVESDLVTNDIDKFTGFNTNIVVLLVTKENKKQVYEEFIDLFKAYFDETPKRTRN